VVRTRVGYAGGSTADPTYRNLDGHSETIQIDFDPTQITYEQLLDLFWASHDPTSRPWSRQYASIVFFHDEEQRRLAVESSDREAARHGQEISTEVVPFSEFHLRRSWMIWACPRSRRLDCGRFCLSSAVDLASFSGAEEMVGRPQMFLGG